MNTPTGDNAFLHDLETEVRAELAQAAASLPEEQAVEAPMDEWMLDPAYTQSEEVGLRNLLGAVEAVEDTSRPDDGRRRRA
ncbi:hypothetical protein [Catellatospora sp. NPDC049111]|uniref:hypothetical protein n=1 Tax=unclassified Catellatospora TaxID=2645785 RepID=UPI0033CB66B2